MNDFLLAAILGVVEGVTEFLPVSSTAHLRIAQHFLGLSLTDEFWKLFAVFIQLGAILAVAVLFRARLLSFARDALAGGLWKRGLLLHPVGLIGLAFFATALPSFLLKKVIGHNLEQLGVMVGALLVGGVVMIVVDIACARRGTVRQVEEMRPWQALVIGLVQTLSAVFPGTSRSMSTIAGAQVVGLTRPAALEFSFLVSIPVMVVATFYDLYKYKKETAGLALSMHQGLVLLVGCAVSFVVAYAVVAWFLGYVRHRGFLPFGVYRIVLGIALYFLL